jgi:hypothetical protein
VRYIIDYYDVASKRSLDRVPRELQEQGAVPSIEVDVRPALDSATALADRMRMLLPARKERDQPGSGATDATTPEAASESRTGSNPAGASGGTAVQGKFSTASLVADAVREACADRMAALQSCQTEREAAIAHIGLTMCIAQQVRHSRAKTCTSQPAHVMTRIACTTYNQLSFHLSGLSRGGQCFHIVEECPNQQ